MSSSKCLQVLNYEGQSFCFFNFISLKSCVVSCFCSVAPIREETDVTCRLNAIYFFKEPTACTIIQTVGSWERRKKGENHTN